MDAELIILIFILLLIALGFTGYFLYICYIITTTPTIVDEEYGLAVRPFGGPTAIQAELPSVRSSLSWSTGQLSPIIPPSQPVSKSIPPSVVPISRVPELTPPSRSRLVTPVPPAIVGSSIPSLIEGPLKSSAPSSSTQTTSTAIPSLWSATGTTEDGRLVVVSTHNPGLMPPNAASLFIRRGLPDREPIRTADYDQHPECNASKWLTTAAPRREEGPIDPNIRKPQTPTKRLTEAQGSRTRKEGSLLEPGIQQQVSQNVSFSEPQESDDGKATGPSRRGSHAIESTEGSVCNKSHCSHYEKSCSCTLPSEDNF